MIAAPDSRMDLRSLLRFYAEAGVAHLSFLDPGDGILETFALTPGQWLLTRTVVRGESVGAPPFDAVPFPLDDPFPFDDPPAPAPEA